MKPGRPSNWDRQAWLDAFEEELTITGACKVTGVGRTTVYEERQKNEQFALGWADVEERIVERMEREAFRRAVEGVDKPCVSAGKLVTTEKQFSDGLIQFLLKARRPEKYRDNVKVEHSGETTTKLEVVIPVDAEERSARAARLLAGHGHIDAP